MLPSQISPSQFEAYAGWASCRKPYLHIYTSNGVSLHELSIKLSQHRKFSADDNDDLCSICADGGELLCCDNWPRAFHPEISAALLWKNLQTYSLMKKIFPTGFSVVISAAMLCFYAYVVMSGGNPPSKKLKSAAAAPS